MAAHPYMTGPTGTPGPSAQYAQYSPSPQAMAPIAVDCPPGLEYLLQVDQLLIKQKVEILETLVGFETNNQYDVCNSMGQKVYLASEDTDCCTRNCCGPNRAFELRIIDHSQREVIHLSRPLRCDCCCCFCCLMYVRVEAPPGNLIGHVRQKWSCLRPCYDVENANGQSLLKISGPFCTVSIVCNDVEFEVLSMDGRQVGRITKQWSGVLREAFTDADIYGVVFPMDLDVKVKACLLAATFLIDYMFFEKGHKKEDKRDLPGMMDTRY